MGQRFTKKLCLFTWFFLSLFGLSYAQSVHIPDPNLRTALLGFYDTNNDGSLSLTEATAATGTLTISSLSITNLTGLEALTNLQAVIAQSNLISQVPDLSAMTALQTLDLRYNFLGQQTNSVPLTSKIPASLQTLDLRDNYLHTGHCSELLALNAGRTWTLEISPNNFNGIPLPLSCAPVAPSVNPTGEVFEARPNFTLSSNPMWADNYYFGIKPVGGAFLNPNWENLPLGAGTTQVAPPSDLTLGQTYELYTKADNNLGSSAATQVGTVTYQNLNLNVAPPSQTSFQLSPGANGQVTFSFSYNFGTGTPPSTGAFAWVWQDVTTSQYWNGQTWSSTANYSQASAWGGVSQTGTTFTYQIDTPLRSQSGPFDGLDRQFRLRYAWQNGASQLVSNDTHLINLAWQSPPGPPVASLSPVGTISEANPLLSWTGVPGATGYKIALFASGNFNQIQFNAAPLVSGTQKTVSLPANLSQEVWIASTRDGSNFGPAVLLGTLTYQPPSFTYGTANPTQLTIDFLDNSTQSFSLPFTSNNLPGALQAQHLQWSWETVIDGQTHYLNNTGFYPMRWDPDLDNNGPFWENVDQMFPNIQISASGLTVNVTQDQFLDRFWLPFAHFNNFGDRQVTIKLRYTYPNNPIVAFSGTPANLQFTRAGVPPAPTGQATPQGNIDTLWPQFSINAVNGTRRYQFYLTGEFSPGQTTTRTFTQPQPQFTTDVPLLSGRTYTLEAETETPAGRSAKTTMGTVTVIPAIEMANDSLARSYDVVENCADPLVITFDIASVSSSFDPSRLTLYLSTTLPISNIPPEDRARWWNGTTWVDTKTGFALGASSGFGAGIEVVGNQLICTWDPNLFTQAFWDREVPTLAGIDYKESEGFRFKASYSRPGPTVVEEDVVRTGGSEWIKAITLRRWKQPEPPASLHNTKCYSLEPRPTISWDAEEFAEDYYIGIFEIGSMAEPTTIPFDQGALHFVNQTATGVVGWDSAHQLTSMPFPMDLDFQKTYSVWLATGFGGCISDFKKVFDLIEFLPEVQPKNPVRFDDPTPGQMFQWEVRGFQTSAVVHGFEGQPIPEAYPFKVNITNSGAIGSTPLPKPTGYSVDCEQLAKYFQVKIYGVDRTASGPNTVYHELAYVLVKFTKLDDPQSNGQGFQRYVANIVDEQMARIGQTLAALNPNPNQRWTDWLQTAYQPYVGIDVVIVEEDNDTATILRTMAITEFNDLIPFEFVPDTQRFSELNLVGFVPDEVLVDPNYDTTASNPPHSRAQFTGNFTFKVEQENQAIHPLDDLWRVTVKLPGENRFWNGSAWTTDVNDMRQPVAGNGLLTPQGLFAGIRINWENTRLDANIDAALFPQAFFDIDGDGMDAADYSRAVEINFSYLREDNGGFIVEEESQYANLTVHHYQPVVLTSLGISSPVPHPMGVDPENTGTTATFEIPITYTLGQAGSPTTPVPNFPFAPPATDLAMTWQANIDGTPHWWNGATWQNQEVRVTIGTAASHSFFSGITPDWVSKKLQGAIPVEAFTTFFGDALQRDLQLTFLFTGTSGEVTSTPVPWQLKIVEPQITVSLDDPMSFLHELPPVGPMYPPEPVRLHEDGRYFQLGRSVSTSQVANFPSNPSQTSLPTDMFAWFFVDHAFTTPVAVQAFLVPFPTENTSLQQAYANRTATHIDLLANQSQITASWQTTHNLAYRYFEVPGTAGVLAVAVYVPNVEVAYQPQFTNLTSNQTSHQPGFTTTKNMLDALLLTEDHSHNRIFSVGYLDGNRQRAMFNIAFTDRLGRPQETHGFASHTTPGMPDLSMIVSGTTKRDAFGRELHSAKGFFQKLNGTPLQDFASAGTRNQTFAAAVNFWQNPSAQQGMPPESYLEGDNFPYTRRVYEQNAQGKVLADLPLGHEGHKLSKLHYSRYHYFTVKPPLLQGLSGVTLRNLPIQQLTSGGVEPCLNGTLVVDPNGAVTVTFTGSDPEVTLITVANPSLAVISSWGLQHSVGATPDSLDDYDNFTVFLPSDYQFRSSRNNGNSANQVSLLDIDAFGRRRGSYPPRALSLGTAGNDWTIAAASGESGLVTTYHYDAFDRLVEMREPDAGITKSRYNLAGQLRFSQNANQAADPNHLRWTETVYDDLGREVIMREVQIDSPSATHLAQRMISATETPASRNTTYYDTYPTNASIWQTRWPDVSDLLAGDPFQRQLIGFGDPLGLIAEVQGVHTAERFYYDSFGRPICRVLLFAELEEPQIFWNLINANDLVLARYHANTQTGQEFIYDAWDRIEEVHDLNPEAIRLVVHEAWSESGGANPGSHFHKLGPFSQAGGGNTTSVPLAKMSYSPTGHLAVVHYGETGQIVQKRRYDVRDWLLEHNFQYANQLLYRSEFAYFQALGGQHTNVAMFDGSISGIRETYGSHVDDSYTQREQVFFYDLSYQLYREKTAWLDTGTLPSTQSRHDYGYDRNGNRIFEYQDNVMEDGTFYSNPPSSYSHTIKAGTNRLQWVSEGGQPFILMANSSGEFYDAMGNLTQLVKNDRDGNTIVQRFSFEDPRYRLLPTKVVQTATDSNGQPNYALRVTSEFSYNTTGIRFKRSIVRHDEAGNPLPADVTYLLPSGNENSAELDHWGRPTRAYLFAGDSRIGFKDHTSTALYLKDHLGSTKMTLALHQPTIADAVLMAYSDTDPYGVQQRENVRARNGSLPPPEPHGFTGQEREPELGLYYYGARYYMPEIGRFLGVDPAREFVNPYSYVGNNPVAFIDPTGESAFKGMLARAWETLVNIPKGVYTSIRHPIQTAKGVKQSLQDMGETVADYYYQAYIREGIAAQVNNSLLSLSDEEIGSMVFDVAAGTFAIMAPFSKAPTTAVVAGEAAAVVQAEAIAVSFTRVGRWMSLDELAKMKETGYVQAGAGGLHRVAVPASSKSYKAAKKGDVYVEYDLPTSSLSKGGQDIWRSVHGPDSTKGRLAKQNGTPVPELPRFKNLSEIIEVKK